MVLLGTLSLNAAEDIDQTLKYIYSQQIHLPDAYQRIASTEQELKNAQQNYIIARSNFESCRQRANERRMVYCGIDALAGAFAGYTLKKIEKHDNEFGPYRRLTKFPIVRGTIIGTLLGLCCAQARTWYFMQNSNHQTHPLTTKFSKLEKKAEYDMLLDKKYSASIKVKDAEIIHENSLAHLHDILQETGQHAQKIKEKKDKPIDLAEIIILF